jgi:thymidylate synthase-like protein
MSSVRATAVLLLGYRLALLKEGTGSSPWRFSGSLTSHFQARKLFIISRQPKFASLGRAWIYVVSHTLEAGTNMGEEGYECLGVEVGFPAEIGHDPILDQFGDAETIANMQKVFFSEGSNPLGHSYAGLIRGPGGRSDLIDVIGLLREEPWSKRAVVTLGGSGNAKVPCINAIQFLIREGAVQVIYFARGQDAFRKFYADALCIASMARTVASSLQIPAGAVLGFIGSCHIYHRDSPAIRLMLEALASKKRIVASGETPDATLRGDPRK